MFCKFCFCIIMYCERLTSSVVMKKCWPERPCVFGPKFSVPPPLKDSAVFLICLTDEFYAVLVLVGCWLRKGVPLLSIILMQKLDYQTTYCKEWPKRHLLENMNNIFFVFWFANSIITIKPGGLIIALFIDKTLNSLNFLTNWVL